MSGCLRTGRGRNEDGRRDPRSTTRGRPPVRSNGSQGRPSESEKGLQMKRARLVVAMLGVAGALALPATAGSAAAAPSVGVRPAALGTCHGKMLDDSNISEQCGGSVDYYRAWVKCTGTSTIFYGSWEQAGS